jgi:hypothetical protein
LDDWTYQTIQVAHYYRLHPFEPDEWFNADFYDAYEFMLVAQEIDRRALETGD